MSLLRFLLLAPLALLVARSPAQERRGDDPAPLRLKLLAEMDARIDAIAARSHIDARLMLDETMPIAFLGMVAELDGGSLRVTQIYRESAADVVGLKVDDRILAFGGVAMKDKAQLYQEIRRFRPGDEVELRVQRAGAELAFKPKLGLRWEEDEEDEAQYGDITAPKFVARGLPATLDLAQQKPGVPPPALEQVLGGLGAPPHFVPFRSGDAVVLRQDANDRMGIRFPMALFAGVDARDVVGRIRFHLSGGAQDRTAGIVLRYRDSANYLVARANAVEGDLRIFRTVNALRRTLPGAVAEVKIDDDRWHTLEFRAEGPKLTAVLDGATTVTSFDTYFLHGRVGLWTKSDAVTDFDQVSFTAPDG